MNKYSIGVDFGGMSAKAGLFCNGELLAKKTVPTAEADGAELISTKIAQLVLSLCDEQKVPFSEIPVVGIGSPGIIDSQHGVVLIWGNYHWKDVPLGPLVSEKLGVPVFVTNDANAAALGEVKFGEGKKFSSAIFVTLGTGVGGGIIIDGKLLEGYRGAGAEIGHLILVKDGEPCGCGRKGCFEKYASATALMRMTKEAIENNPDSEMATWETVNGRTAFECAKHGDKAAQEVVDTYIDYLAEGLADLTNIFRPEAFLIGGGVSNEGENLLTPLRKKVEEKIFLPSSIVPLAIEKASLGNDAGIYGAMAYGLSRI